MSRILVVEDDQQVRELIVEMLKRSGHEVRVAEDGNAALRLLDAETIDLIITDLIMPEMEGMQTIRELRKRDPQVPLIAMSGGGRVNADDYLETALLMGANHSLRKPFTRSDLIDAVEGLLG